MGGIQDSRKQMMINKKKSIINDLFLGPDARLFRKTWFFPNFRNLNYCRIIKMLNDPTACAFDQIAELGEKNALILYNDQWYFADQKKLRVEKVKTRNADAEKCLKNEFSDRETLNIVAEHPTLAHYVKMITGYDHLNTLDSPISQTYILDIIRELFLSPFASINQFRDQVFNILVLPLTCVVVEIYIPIYCLTKVFSLVLTNSRTDAINITMDVLDRLVELFDAAIKLMVFFPIQISSFLVKGGLTLFSSTPDQEVENRPPLNPL